MRLASLNSSKSTSIWRGLFERTHTLAYACTHTHLHACIRMLMCDLVVVFLFISRQRDTDNRNLIPNFLFTSCLLRECRMRQSGHGSSRTSSANSSTTNTASTPSAAAMPASSRPRGVSSIGGAGGGGGSGGRSANNAPMSERQQMALLMQMTNSGNSNASGRWLDRLWCVEAMRNHQLGRLDRVIVLLLEFLQVHASCCLF